MANIIRAILIILTFGLLSACGGGGGSAGNTTGSKLFTSATEKVTISPGEVRNFSARGGVPGYTATSSNSSVAIVSIVGTSFSITGAKFGTADVYVRDSSGDSVKIEVTIAVNSSTFEVLPGDVTGLVGDALNFKISGGSPPFDINNNNQSIAMVTPIALVDGVGFTAKLLNVGTTDVSVVDAQGKVKTLKITVKAATSSVLRLSPSSFTIGEDFKGIVPISIIGATGPYTALTSDLVLSGVSVAGETLNVDLGIQASRCITVAAGETYSVILTIIDSNGTSATSTMIIKDNSKGGAGCL